MDVSCFFVFNLNKLMCRLELSGAGRSRPEPVEAVGTVGAVGAVGRYGARKVGTVRSS